MPTTEFGHSCLNSKCDFHDRERPKAVSGAGLTGEMLVLSERKGMMGETLGCLLWLCFVLQLGKDVVGLSHKIIILKYFDICFFFFLKYVGPFVCLFGLGDTCQGTSKSASRCWSLVFHLHPEC